MSDSIITCLLVIPYSHRQMMMEVSAQLKVKEIMAMLAKKYHSQPQPLYFYLPENQRILDMNLSLEKQMVKDGDIIYWI